MSVAQSAPRSSISTLRCSFSRARSIVCARSERTKKGRAEARPLITLPRRTLELVLAGHVVDVARRQHALMLDNVAAVHAAIGRSVIVRAICRGRVNRGRVVS